MKLKELTKILRPTDQIRVFRSEQSNKDYLPTYYSNELFCGSVKEFNSDKYTQFEDRVSCLFNKKIHDIRLNSKNHEVYCISRGIERNSVEIKSTINIFILDKNGELKIRP